MSQTPSITNITDRPPNIQLFRGTGPLQLQPQEFGTVCRQNYENRLVVLPVQAVAEDIFIWTVRPRRIVNFSLLRRVEIFLLTYLQRAQPIWLRHVRCVR